MKRLPTTGLRSIYIFVGLALELSFCVRAFGEDALEHEIDQLVEKYGADSVARAALQRQKAQSPKSAEKPATEALVNTSSETGLPGIYGFLVRRSYSDVTSAEDPSISNGRGSYEEANPAQFSYTRDFLSGSNQWAAVGSVIRPFHFDLDGAPSSKTMVLDSLSLVPSITFDRVSDDTNRAKNVDSLTFRVGLFGEVAGGPRPLRLMDFRLYATYATNFHLDSGVVAGEFDWEPTTSLPGNRTFRRLFRNHSGAEGRAGSLLEFHWRFFVHSEFGGHTGSDLPSSTMQDFFRTGPVLELKIDPFFFQRLTGTLNYSYLAGPIGTPAQNHHLLAGLSFILDPDPKTQHWTLDATYEDGDTPLVNQNVQTFLLSLGVKY